MASVSGPGCRRCSCSGSVPCRKPPALRTDSRFVVLLDDALLLLLFLLLLLWRSPWSPWLSGVVRPVCAVFPATRHPAGHPPLRARWSRSEPCPAARESTVPNAGRRLCRPSCPADDTGALLVRPADVALSPQNAPAGPFENSHTHYSQME